MKKYPYIFLLGKLGSGKSTIYELFVQLLKEKYGESTTCIKLDDFPILEAYAQKTGHMSQKEDGFALRDSKVLNEVLQLLSEKAILASKTNHFVFIEFARDSYEQALKQFSKTLWQQALVLYIYCDFEKCLERNAKRYQKYHKKDSVNHIVPSDIMHSYYKEDDYEAYYVNHLQTELKKKIDTKLVILDNTDESIEALQNKIAAIVEIL